MEDAKAIVSQQAEDQHLWLPAKSAHAQYLQKELRRLHEAVEGKTSAECARAVLD